MTDIPAEDLERAQAMVERVRDALAGTVARLPYDAEMAVDLCPPEDNQ